MLSAERNPVLLALEQTLRAEPDGKSDAAVTERHTKGYEHEELVLSSFDQVAVFAAAAKLLRSDSQWRIVERTFMGQTHKLELHRPLAAVAAVEVPAV